MGKVKEKLDKQTLDVLKLVYKPGTKVTAVNVAGIPEGKVGYVKRVEADGDILLMWDTGEDCRISHERETVRVASECLCTIGNIPNVSPGCTETACEICGWNKNVAADRKRRIESEGLTEGRDGLRRLKIRRRMILTEC